MHGIESLRRKARSCCGKEPEIEPMHGFRRSGGVDFSQQDFDPALYDRKLFLREEGWLIDSGSRLGEFRLAPWWWTPILPSAAQGMHQMILRRPVKAGRKRRGCGGLLLLLGYRSSRWG